ncbi:diguanylate cyclase [Leptospira ryugenii]|uniref:Diguanylate cyclase n=1 Tax=Leptospira ryugenii TaxID=1917863 RepID=A0A2P2E3G7_9LEPT|nr:sensor domain-containing diguanylate cyclase [Leptospira ryugenii]GBF51411.1 diguanylate cyclase [Leptospira ryugenii]
MTESQLQTIAKHIIEKSLDSIVVLDSDSKMIYANPALLKLSGYQKQELISKSLDFLFPHEINSDETKALKVENFLIGENSNYISGNHKEFDLYTKKGDLIPIELRIFEINEDENNRKQYSVRITDIREKKKLEEQKTLLINSLKRLAYMDELTLLPNRRSFYDSLQKTIAIVKRRNRDAILAVLDIDHFKGINDTYGHDIGDVVLKKIANIFMDCLREEDTVGRVGGEEFGCILPDTSQEGAVIVLERIRESVRNHRFFIFDNFYLNVTVSIGYTRVHPTHKPEEVIKFADIALYQAKNSGRDKIQSYPV